MTKHQRWYARHKDEPGFMEAQRTKLRKSRERRKYTPEFRAQKAKHDLRYRLKVRDSEDYRKKRNEFNLKFRRRKPETSRQSVYNWRERNPEKALAHQAVRLALRRGELVRPNCCTNCAVPDTPLRDGRTGLHAHHVDYSKPLEVYWLCPLCHAKERRLHI